MGGRSPTGGVPLAPGDRATTAGPGPQQTGDFRGVQGLAPWLTQGQGSLPAYSNPGVQVGNMQDKALEMQARMAEAIRNAPKYVSPSEGPDFSEGYDAHYGSGAYSAEAKRYMELDAANQLGDYERLYGEFPEDPAAQEEWFRKAQAGGTAAAAAQGA